MSISMEFDHMSYPQVTYERSSIAGPCIDPELEGVNIDTSMRQNFSLTLPFLRTIGRPLISLLRIDDFTHDAMRLHRRARCSSLFSFDCDCRMAS